MARNGRNTRSSSSPKASAIRFFLQRLRTRSFTRFPTVDDFVAVKAPTSARINSFQRAARNGFNRNHLESAGFHRFQQSLESGSGPGGRRFKSSLAAMVLSSPFVITRQNTSSDLQKPAGGILRCHRWVRPPLASAIDLQLLTA